MALMAAAERHSLANSGINRINSTYSPRAQQANFLRDAYGTAARSGYVRNLRWDYVDLDEESVTFHDPKTGTGYTVPLGIFVPSDG